MLEQKVELKPWLQNTVDDRFLTICLIFISPGVISEGRTVLKYHANSNQMLSFGQSQPVRIFSKGDGSQQDIWGVEVRKKSWHMEQILCIFDRMQKNVVYLSCQLVLQLSKSLLWFTFLMDENTSKYFYSYFVGMKQTLISHLELKD